MEKDVKVLGNLGYISGTNGHHIVMFFEDQDIVCERIARFYNVKINRDASIRWDILLNKYYGKSNYANNGHVFFPEFETIKELENFILSLNTQFLINIV